MSPSPTAISPAATVTATPAPGYPSPIIRQSNNLIGGYYLDGYDDVAVLSVPSFVSLDTAEEEFQQVGETFLAAAKAAGKTKLIIDVSANGGGTILQGYDL
jgi:C-terminal processing protease CtpA/Prc